jgi:hypothetical protein
MVRDVGIHSTVEVVAGLEAAAQTELPSNCCQAHTHH